MAISAQTFHVCHTVLLRCDEFDSHQRMQGMFITHELKYVKHRLPEAQNRAMRVTGVLELLVEAPATGASPLLAIFLDLLSARYSDEHELHHDLKNCAQLVRQELGQAEVVQIPVVIFAMTNSEARELFSLSVFGEVENSSFSQLLVELRKAGLEDAQQMYGEEREEWTYMHGAERTIEQLIEEVFERKNAEMKERVVHNTLFEMTPFSQEFFSSVPETRKNAWKQLGQRGCIIVADAVSLFHPALRSMLVQSQLTSDPKTAMLLLSPTELEESQLRTIVSSEVEATLELGFDRYMQDLDQAFEIMPSNKLNLERWLFSILPIAAASVQRHRMDPRLRASMREKLGVPLGIDQLIIRERGAD